MDGDVETKKLHEGLICTEAEKRGKVMGIIFMRVDSRELAITKNIAINSSRNVRKLGNAEIEHKHRKMRQVQTTHRSIASSKVGPQYSFLETPS